jgi:hypothetical protein
LSRIHIIPIKEPPVAREALLLLYLKTFAKKGPKSFFIVTIQLAQPWAAIMIPIPPNRERLG